MTLDKGVSFKVTAVEVKAIDAIMRRVNLGVSSGLSLRMDLTATHVNGCPLDFKRLLAFPDFSFWHDLSGIIDNIDRETGKLRNFFVPRCAKPENRS